MVNRNSQSAKKLALKNKLKTTKLLTKTSKAAAGTTGTAAAGTGSGITKSRLTSTPSNVSGAAGRKQRIKELAQIKGILGISKSSTKHNAGRKDVCESLDRAVMDSSVSEMLRGVGKASELTEEQKVSLARKKRETQAIEYEQHQSAVTATVDELAQLMSDSIGS
ncbi:hypothetical protein LPJ56_000642 [Coemansia sp. RSA 2599]|nr:hypothetical protein LPJ75_000306 [Coemansia sp. RSA 2598]KAJ1829081.1 hypothetical protein LPJ56_000642 [Coemansia sp. RSA 2599]